MHLPRHHKYLLCLLMSAAFLLQSTKAQYPENNFVRYTVKDGLNDNFIVSVQQDAEGYIWVGTDFGLSRFDGNSFNKFYQGKTPVPLRSNSIMKLKDFGSGQMGILSKGGFQLLNTGNFSLQNFYIPDTTSFSTQRNATWDAIALPDQSYAVTSAAAFQVYDKNGKVVFAHNAYSMKDIGIKRILYGRNIFSINEHEYLIYVEEGGLAYYNHKEKIFRNVDSTDLQWSAFLHPSKNNPGRWIIKQQLSPHEFIFASTLGDSIIYYNHRQRKKVISPMPFFSTAGLHWESKLSMLGKDSFIINSAANGFFVFNINRETGWITSNGQRYFAGHKVNSIFRDKDKRLWIATPEGLFKQRLNAPLISAYKFPNPEGMNGELHCSYSYKNKLYTGHFSSLANGGLIIIDPSTMKVEKEVKFFGGSNRWNEIFSIESYHPDTLWLGTSGGLLWFDTKSHNYNRVMYKDTALFFSILAPARADGYAWMCSYLGGKVARYHIPSRSFTFFTSKTTPALPFDKVKSIAYDSYGNVWIGGHSLTRWNNKSQSFDTVLTSYAGINKYNDDIRCLTADDHGSLWLHTAYNGLLQYRIKEKRFSSYTMDDGIASDALFNFSPVINDILWIGSNNNITRFDTKTKKIFIYDEDDGLPDSRPSGWTISLDKETNSLYMCSNEYLVKFPFTLDKAVYSGSELLIQELVINNKRSIFQPAAEQHLKYNENNLVIRFTIIDFEKSNYQFAYRINDADNWNNLGLQRSLNLDNLSPGTYKVQIKATGKSGNEKIKEIVLLIEPPFWKTIWFLLLCGLLLIGAIVFIYLTRVKQIRQRADVDRLLAQTEMKALHAQMNPHFIFNSLNSIREMILSNENKEASHFLSKFAHLIRITLDQSGQTFVSLRNTIDYLKRYTEMEQIRKNNFTCSIEVDDALDLDESLLPPMLIQPFIENAIWHGTPARQTIAIKVGFKKEGKAMICTINDNGIGINQSMKNKTEHTITHQSLGISNIRNRITLLNEKYHLDSDIKIVDKKDLPGDNTGTLVILRLPLEINEL